jgi:hypothetical protein
MTVKERRAPLWHEQYNWDMLAWLAVFIVVVAFALWTNFGH